MGGQISQLWPPAAKFTEKDLPDLSDKVPQSLQHGMEEDVAES